MVLELLTIIRFQVPVDITNSQSSFYFLPQNHSISITAAADRPWKKAFHVLRGKRSGQQQQENVSFSHPRFLQ
jgi:hypothetical protein